MLRDVAASPASTLLVQPQLFTRP